VCVCVCMHANILACVKSSESLPPTQTKHNKQIFTITLYPLYATHLTAVRPHAHTHQMRVLCNHFMAAHTRIIYRSSHLTNSNHLLFMWFYVEKSCHFQANTGNSISNLYPENLTGFYNH